MVACECLAQQVQALLLLLQIQIPSLREGLEFPIADCQHRHTKVLVSCPYGNHGVCDIFAVLGLADVSLMGSVQGGP